MKPFPLPVVAFGPGSQQEDENLEYMDMPKDMHTFSMPGLTDDMDPALRDEALDLARNLVDRMRATGFGVSDYPSIDLSSTDMRVRAAINDLLGEGEVAAYSRGAVDCRVQETAFAGVWRVLQMATDGGIARDTVEACAIPRLIVDGARRSASTDVSVEPPPPGAMNAPAVLAEVLDAARSHHPGDEARIINLTLLPMTPDDLEYLAKSLGGGSTVILSRGYGNCRISSTGVTNVWWVQYFNSMDHMILNTLEIVDVPEVALAAKEDYSDSVERLEEWIAVSADI